MNRRIISGMLAAAALPVAVLPVLLLIFQLVGQDTGASGRLAVLMMLEIWLWALAGAVYGGAYQRLPGARSRSKGAALGAGFGLLIALFFAPLVLHWVQGPLAVAPFDLTWAATFVLLPLLYIALWQVVGAIFDTLQRPAT